MKPKKTIRPEHKKQHAKNTIRSIKRHWQLYLIVALPLVYLIVFKYMPIIGSQIAFRDYNFKGGIWHSPFVGLKYFKMFFQSPQFWRLMGNTLGLSVYGIVLGVFPPIILATVYKGNIIKNLIMDCQSYTKYRPNETTGGIFVSWRRKEELPTGA